MLKVPKILSYQTLIIGGKWHFQRPFFVTTTSNLDRRSSGNLAQTLQSLLPVSGRSFSYQAFLFMVGMTTVVACSQKEITEPAFLQSREGRGKLLIDDAVAAGEGISLDSVYFDTDKSTLKPSGKEQLRKHAEWLKKHPKTQVQIEGSCDDRGSEDYNLKLGQRRAGEAKRFLIELGIDSERIAIVSHGKLPGSENHVRAGNRRGQFVVFYVD